MVRYEIVIPAYNEAHRIQRTLDHYLRFFDETVNFIVVLNGCRDQTLTVIEKVSAKFPGRITIVNISAAIGKGGAIREGWARTQADWVGMVDADGATDPQEFSKLMQAAAGHDGAIASRFLPGAKIVARVSWMRSLVSVLATRIIRLLFCLPYSDTQCGAKVFRRQIIYPLLPKFTTTNWLFDVELLWWLRRQRRDIVDVPTIWVDQPGSASLGHNWKFLFTAGHLFGNMITLRLRILKQAD